MTDTKIADKVYKPHVARSRYPFNPARCAEGVSRDWNYYQCVNPGVVEEGGHQWCRQHAPSAEDARAAKRDAAVRAKNALSDRQYEREQLFRAIAVAALSANIDALPPLVRDAVRAYLAAKPAGPTCSATDDAARTVLS